MYGVAIMAFGSLGRALTGLLRLKDAENAGLIASGIALPAWLFFINLTSYFITFLLGAWLIYKLSPRFGSMTTFATMLTVIVFSYTPFLMMQIVPLTGVYGRFVSVAGLIYTVWLYAKGASVMACIPSQRVAGFTLVSFFILFGIFYIVSLVSSGLLIFELQ